MKIYIDKNVYKSFIERVNYIFDEFELVYISFSGGKDSSVAIQLLNEIAKKRNRIYDVFYLDLEAQYSATINHVNEIKKLSNIRDFYHQCVPLNLTNSSSVFQTHWTCWDENVKDKWVRKMPIDCININNHPFGDYFKKGEEFETWMVKFPKWLMQKNGVNKCAGIVGIRADESFNRFRAIAFGKNIYKGNNWSTDNGHGYYSFYPIYDWKTQDIWHAVSKFDLLYNNVYEMLWKNRISIHEQRICHPYGSDQRVSLNQWAVLEPETWHKVVNRVSGANYGNIYCKTSLLGHNGTEKPEFMTWQEYTVFLLESLGLYSKTLELHYVRKLNIYFKYYKDNYDMDISDIPDYRPPKEAKEHGKGISWKRIAKCIEKNDFICKGLSYGITKADIEEAKIIKHEFGEASGFQEKTKSDKLLKQQVYG
jgi:predicted phosphoadenosine phosphosulfate sulfurtransferase